VASRTYSLRVTPRFETDSVRSTEDRRVRPWAYKYDPWAEDFFSVNPHLPPLPSSRYFPCNIMLFAAIITTIFLTVNHLCSTFASPIIESKGSITESLNVTHSLAKRADIPTDQKCDQDTDWVGRVCLTSVDDRTWEDSCITDALVRYSRLGSCLPTEVCMNQLNRPDEILAVCLERPKSDMQYISNRQMDKGFMGFYLIKSVADVAEKQHRVSVKIGKDVTDASVAAFLEGM
jgi:hypothetical protein